MKFFQRIEVWLLLLIGGGAAVWVLLSNPAEDNGNPESVPVAENTAQGTEQAKPPITIYRCTLERDYGNARLDIELRYRNASPRPLILHPPDVRLLTGDGKEVPVFILPIEKPPQIAAQTAQDVRLRFWLEKPHLQGPLTLSIRGQTAEVKTAAPLDFDALEQKKPKTWTGVISN